MSTAACLPLLVLCSLVLWVPPGPRVLPRSVPPTGSLTGQPTGPPSSPNRVALPADEQPAVAALAGGTSASRGLVVLLHGGSWSPREREELARRALNACSSDARRVGLRLLVPLLPQGVPAWAPGDGEHTVPWLSPQGEAAVLALIDGEVAAGRADPARVYLAGHGAGASAALLLGARHAGRFAALACWSGAPPPLWDDERRVVGLVEDPVPRLRGVPVYLWSGNDDRTLDRAALGLFVREMLDRSREDDAFSLRWDQGDGGHDFGGKKGPRRGLRFLKGHRKRQRP